MPSRGAAERGVCGRESASISSPENRPPPSRSSPVPSADISANNDSAELHSSSKAASALEQMGKDASNAETCCGVAVQAQQQPEVLRMPLESLCLSVKAALPGAQRLQTALGRLISPPQPDAVAAAVASLTHLGALDADDEALTALGRHLTLMPMDARLAKTLIYAVMLRSWLLINLHGTLPYGSHELPYFRKRAICSAAYGKLAAHSLASVEEGHDYI